MLYYLDRLSEHATSDFFKAFNNFVDLAGRHICTSSCYAQVELTCTIYVMKD